MLILSESKLNELKSQKFRVYSASPLSEGVECFNSNESLKDSNYYISHISPQHIRHENGKFFYTNEDLSIDSTWFPAAVFPVIGAFASSNKKLKKGASCTDIIKSQRSGKLSKSCLVDVSELPAFSTCANEDVIINEYRLYLTLFNEYTIRQCHYDRHDLYDAKFNSSKYDLTANIQNSDCLKSKDFKIINARRVDDESVPVGYVIKEDKDNKYEIDYGTVYIDMNNMISIKWH